MTRLGHKSEYVCEFEGPWLKCKEQSSPYASGFLRLLSLLTLLSSLTKILSWPCAKQRAGSSRRNQGCD